MVMEIYSIKDKKVAFMTPYFQANKEIALRNFKNAVNNTDMAKDPADYELWKIGKFDDKTGNVTEETEYIASATEFVK